MAGDRGDYLYRNSDIACSHDKWSSLKKELITIIVSSLKGLPCASEER